MNYNKILDLYEDSSIHRSIPYMEFVRELTSDVASIRKMNGIPESYPLVSLDLYIGDDLFPLVNELWFAGYSQDRFDTPYRELIKDSCNVDEVEFNFSSDWYIKTNGLSETITLDFRKAGPVFGKDMGKISKAVKSGNFVKKENSILVDGLVISDEFYSTSIESNNTNNTKILLNDSFIVLSTGLRFGKSKYESNVLSREINNTRKSLNVGISDRVSAVVYDSEENIELVSKHLDDIKFTCKLSSLEFRESSFARSITLGSCSN